MTSKQRLTYQDDSINPEEDVKDKPELGKKRPAEKQLEKSPGKKQKKVEKKIPTPKKKAESSSSEEEEDDDEEGESEDSEMAIPTLESASKKKIQLPKVIKENLEPDTKTETFESEGTTTENKVTQKSKETPKKKTESKTVTPTKSQTTPVKSPKKVVAQESSSEEDESSEAEQEDPDLGPCPKKFKKPNLKKLDGIKSLKSFKKEDNKATKRT